MTAAARAGGPCRGASQAAARCAAAGVAQLSAGRLGAHAPTCRATTDREPVESALAARAPDAAGLRRAAGHATEWPKLDMRPESSGLGWFMMLLAHADAQAGQATGRSGQAQAATGPSGLPVSPGMRSPQGGFGPRTSRRSKSQLFSPCSSLYYTYHRCASALGSDKAKQPSHHDPGRGYRTGAAACARACNLRFGPLNKL